MRTKSKPKKNDVLSMIIGSPRYKRYIKKNNTRRNKYIKRTYNQRLRNNSKIKMKTISRPKIVKWTSIDYEHERTTLQLNLSFLVKVPQKLRNIDPNFHKRELTPTEAIKLDKYIKTILDSHTYTWINNKPFYNYLIRLNNKKFLYMYDKIDDITANLEKKNDVKKIFNAAFNTIIRGNIDEELNSDGDTSLIIASRSNYFRVVDTLLRRKDVNIDYTNHNDDTALMVAAWEGNEYVIRLLLRKGADKTKENYNGDTAMILAQRKGYRHIVKLLS